MLDSIKTARVLKKAMRHPLRAVRRLVDDARFAQLDEAQERDAAIAFLSNTFNTDIRTIHDEHRRSGFDAWMDRRAAQLDASRVTYRLGSTSQFDCETIYLLVRALKPEVVVETGVCYGKSSAYILRALQENRRGALYSIDLGNTHDEPPNDYFIPRQLLDRWHLIVGDSRRHLPPLLAQLGRIDLFHHDSLHTYEHMMWEYDTAFAHLDPDGVLSSDDVRTTVDIVRPFQRNPFAVFCDERRLDSVVSRNVGIATRSSA
jgi:predicted O-methyltransferase YrrM